MFQRFRNPKDCHFGTVCFLDSLVVTITCYGSFRMTDCYVRFCPYKVDPFFKPWVCKLRPTVQKGLSGTRRYSFLYKETLLAKIKYIKMQVLTER